VDILFHDVIWMALPVWFEGLRIARAAANDVPQSLPSLIQREIPFHNVYRLTTDRVDHFIIAGSRVFVSEERHNYSDDSPLIPGLKVTQTFPD
jgi:hypothetical protein